LIVLGFLQSIFTRDMGIDLGTANTLVHVKGRGIVIQEPSVVALASDTGAVLAVGQEAKQMIGRTPGNIIAVRPMRDGVIADFEVTQTMLRHFIRKACSRSALVQRPLVVVAIPSGVTEVERRAVEGAAMQAGARQVFTIEEPIAGAVGAGMAIEEPRGNMVVDVGGGTTEVAVISLGGIVAARSIRIAGDEMDEAITAYIRRTYSLAIGDQTAEAVKIRLGSAFPCDVDETTMDVRGRDLVAGLPRTVKIVGREVRDALAEPIAAVLEAIKVTLEHTPPELASDVIDRGIVLTGGGSLLRGLDRLVAQATGVPVFRAEQPLLSVVLGAGKIVEDQRLMRALAQRSRRYRS
jgi:rod shape-determining protein MreB